MTLGRGRITITVLIFAGWILPTVWPEYGVPFGLNSPRNPEWYWSYVYLGEAGFFSEAVVIENTWEGSHGHTWPKGPWICGYGLTAWFCASVLLLSFKSSSARVVTLTWTVLRVLLVCWAVVTFLVPAELPVRSLALLGVFVVYWLIARAIVRNVQGRRSSSSESLVAAISVAFYPIWILALCSTFMIPPFLGLLAYAGATGLLICHFHKNSVAEKVASGGS